MALEDFIALLPLLVTALSSLGVLLLAAFHREHRFVAVVTSLGLAVAFFTLPVAAGVAPRQVTPLLRIDAYALFYAGLILAASLAVTILSYGYLEKQEGQREEFYALLLFATLGAMTLAAASHFAAFFLGLELLSVSLYVLIAYVRTDGRPLANALGQPATVYVPIPAIGCGTGKVQLSMQNRIVEYQAITDESAPLKTGEKVEVVGIKNSDTVAVRRVAQAVEKEPAAC